MQTNPKLRLQLRLQGGIFVVLLLLALGLLGWLSTRYTFEADWTAAARHTLAEASIQVLEELEGPLQITSFSRAELSPELRQRTRELVARYQRHSDVISLQFIDPDQQPQRVRELGISTEGELLLEYQGRQQTLRVIGEQALSNAILGLLREGERRVYFLSGHGERRFDGQANHDLSLWAGALQQKGFRFRALNLGTTGAVPEDAHALVLASPQAALLAGELSLLLDYLERGGNLLWLSEPDGPEEMMALAEALDLFRVPGTLIDPGAAMLGIDNPAMVIVSEYPPHPITRQLSGVTLFPVAHAWKHFHDSAWDSFPLLNSHARSWSETGPLEGEIRYIEGEDHPGPLTLGMLLERPHPAGEGKQRVAVIGDGDFLANNFLGNAANQELGERLLNWLSHDDRFLHIAPRTAPDQRLDLGRAHSLIIGFGFLIALPLLLLGSGLGIWWRRRSR